MAAEAGGVEAGGGVWLMAKRTQFCSRCKFPIRHGIPRGQYLFCSEVCVRGDRPKQKAIAAQLYEGASS